MQTAQDTFRRMMRGQVAPELRSLGFKGSGQVFRLPRDDHWALVGFQKSAWNSRDQVRFTVNLTVVRRDVWDEERSNRPRLPDQPSANTFYGSFLWQTRISRLMPVSTDVWWSVSADSDPTNVVTEVLAAIRDYALPAMRPQMA